MFPTKKGTYWLFQRSILYFLHCLAVGIFLDFSINHSGCEVTTTPYSWESHTRLPRWNTIGIDHGGLEGLEDGIAYLKDKQN